MVGGDAGDDEEARMEPSRSWYGLFDIVEV